MTRTARASGLERTLAELIKEYRKHAPLLRAVNELASYEPAVEEYWRAAINDFATLVAERIVREQSVRRSSDRVRANTTATWITWGTERTIAMHVAAASGRHALGRRARRGIAAATWAAMHHV